MDDIFTGRNFSIGFGFIDDLRNIVADGFRQTGGMNGDDVRSIHGKNVVDGLKQVGLAAEHRRPFGEGAGGSHDRFLEMAGQGTAVIRITALGPVAVRQASVDAQGRIHGADWLTGLGRIDG